jgi:hypothetical protein
MLMKTFQDRLLHEREDAHAQCVRLLRGLHARNKLVSLLLQRRSSSCTDGMKLENSRRRLGPLLVAAAACGFSPRAGAWNVVLHLTLNHTHQLPRHVKKVNQETYASFPASQESGHVHVTHSCPCSRKCHSTMLQRTLVDTH